MHKLTVFGSLLDVVMKIFICISRLRVEKLLQRFEMNNLISTYQTFTIRQTSVKDEAKKALQGHKKEITKLANRGRDRKKLAGCKVLLDELK